MAWDDTAPTQQELEASPTSGWDSAPPTPSELGSPPYDPQGIDKEKFGPGLQDVSVPDAMTAEGVAGLGKLGAGLVAKGAGAALDAIPFTKNIVPSVGQVATNQTLKGFGGTMGQITQMAKGRGGKKALSEAAKFARDKGLGDVFSTSVGRENLMNQLLDESGSKVGALRQEAGTADPTIIDRIVQNPKIDRYLGKGSASKELGDVDTALHDVREVGGEAPTHASLADAATYINKDAAGAKLFQPVNAKTDVANILSGENDADIVQKLGSDKGKQYLDALSEQTKLHPLEHLQQKGELREMGGRGGLGTRFIQAIADEFGYRMSAKAAGALHDALLGDGLIQKVPGMAAKSGAKLVPNEIADWIRSKSG